MPEHSTVSKLRGCPWAPIPIQSSSKPKWEPHVIQNEMNAKSGSMTLLLHVNICGHSACSMTRTFYVVPISRPMVALCNSQSMVPFAEVKLRISASECSRILVSQLSSSMRIYRFIRKEAFAVAASSNGRGIVTAPFTHF